MTMTDVLFVLVFDFIFVFVGQLLLINVPPLSDLLVRQQWFGQRLVEQIHGVVLTAQYDLIKQRKQNEAFGGQLKLVSEH